jgi:hypothetical protein
MTSGCGSMGGEEVEKFAETELAHLIADITTINAFNAFNRFGVSTRMVPGHHTPSA